MMKGLERHIDYNPDVPTHPSIAKKSRSQVAKDLWQDENYREKTLQALKQRKHDPNFIAKMRLLRQGIPSPMEGKNHLAKTVNKIQQSVQRRWNEIHGIQEPESLLAKRNALFTEWLRLSQLLRHSPSSTEITRLKKENKTRFSVTMYKKEFGEGSFMKAKKVLSLEYAQNFIVSLANKSKQLSKYQIPEEDINRYSAQIKNACDKIFSSASSKEISQLIEQLNLFIRRISRKISAMTPLTVDVE